MKAGIYMHDLVEDDWQELDDSIRRVTAVDDRGTEYTIKLIDGGIEIYLGGRHIRRAAVLPRSANVILVRGIDR